MAEKKLSLNSDADEILAKVNKAISDKKNPPQEEDILELFEEAEPIAAESNLTLAERFASFSQASTSAPTSTPEAIEKIELLEQPISSFDNSKIEEPLQSQVQNDELTKAENINKSDNNDNKELKGKNMSDKLVSDNTAEATSALLKQLKQSATSKSASDGLKFNSGTTVEEIVTELIKPHLSAWLDEHLPVIVKNVVEREVKKLMPTED